LYSIVVLVTGCADCFLLLCGLLLGTWMWCMAKQAIAGWQRQRLRIRLQYRVSLQRASSSRGRALQSCAPTIVDRFPPTTPQGRALGDAPSGYEGYLASDRSFCCFFILYNSISFFKMAFALCNCEAELLSAMC